MRIAGAGAGRVWEAVLCRDAVGSDAGRLPAAGASEAAFWGGSDRESGASVIKNRAQAQVLADVSHFAHLGARRSVAPAAQPQRAMGRSLLRHGSRWRKHSPTSALFQAGAPQAVRGRGAAARKLWGPQRPR